MPGSAYATAVTGIQPQRKNFPVSLAIGLAVVVAMVGGSLILSRVLSANTTEAARISEYRRAITDLIGGMRDAEIGQRGYLLTGDRRYLDPYLKAVGTLDPAMTRTAQYGGARGRDVVRRLDPIVSAKIEELARTVTLADSGNREAALAIIRTDIGRNLMDRIRVVFEAERQWTIAQTDALSARSARAVTMLTTGLIAGIMAIIVLALLWVRQTRAQIADLATAHDDTAIALAGLKQEGQAREDSEAQVRQLQKMQAVGQLTGGIAHDFNNMLAVVMSGIEMAKRRLRTDLNEAEMFLDASLDGARRGTALTSRLLAFSRNQPLTPAPVDLNRLIGGMSEMLERALGESVAVETVRAAGLWRCYADAGEIENALLNLAVNARDAMPDGGKLTIETCNVHVDDDYSRRHAEIDPGQYVQICVTDTGEGMPPDVIERAFDPFFTTKAVGKGTGLGLSQVYGFCKQSGGHASIYSEVGEGTTIKLYLPRFFGTEELAEPVVDRSEAPAGSASEIVLIVEDEARVRQLAESMLNELGYTAIAVAGPLEALEIVKARDDIALLFTDIVMPDMNGRKLADLAREKRPDLKILYTTGYTRNAVVHNGMVDIGVAFLPKPYSIHDMARKVRDVIDGRGVNRVV